MSLTKVSFSMIEGQVANVLDFGADPTGVADSTQAFNDALVAAKEVFIPAGTYSVTSITMPDYQTIMRGEGYDHSKINTTGSFGVTFGPNTASRNSELRNLGIYAAPGTTALRVRNLGLNIFNCIFRGGQVGILCQNSVLHVWENVIAYGSYAGLHIKPETAQDVVWACHFTNVAVSGNVLADFAFGMLVENTPFNTVYFLRGGSFLNLDAEQTGTGIRIVADSANDNTFINTWIEIAKNYYLEEDDLSRNTWINTHRTPAGLAPTNGIKFSVESLEIVGNSWYPVSTGVSGVGNSAQVSLNLFEPKGVQLVANDAVAASNGLYISNQTQKITSYFDDYAVVEKAFQYGTTATSTDIIEIETLDESTGNIEVELSEMAGSGNAQGGTLKYRRAYFGNLSTNDVTFATIDTDYKNSFSDITFTSVNSKKFRLTYTFATTQPTRLGVCVRVTSLVSRGNAPGVKVTSLI